MIHGGLGERPEIKLLHSTGVASPIGRTYVVHEDDAEGIRLRCRECPEFDQGLIGEYPGDRTDGGVPSWSAWDQALAHVQEAHGGKPYPA